MSVNFLSELHVSIANFEPLHYSIAAHVENRRIYKEAIGCYGLVVKPIYWQPIGVCCTNKKYAYGFLLGGFNPFEK